MIKLNLGCGRRKKTGYINVDVTQRGDIQPDIEADVRDLPFHENYADEVLAVHVIEHFYLWEVDQVLNEWIRVLKPGGKLIIECPDIVKACYHMIKAISEGTEPHKQFTMWPIYGDPDHKDPLMCHRWGWTPQSLGSRLKSLGMKEIEEKDAQYHMGPVRDMRLEAVK